MNNRKQGTLVIMGFAGEPSFFGLTRLPALAFWGNRLSVKIYWLYVYFFVEAGCCMGYRGYRAVKYRNFGEVSPARGPSHVLQVLLCFPLGAAACQEGLALLV